MKKISEMFQGFEEQELLNERNAYECDVCGERAEPEEIEENPRMRCSNCGSVGQWVPEH